MRDAIPQNSPKQNVSGLITTLVGYTVNLGQFMKCKSLMFTLNVSAILGGRFHYFFTNYLVVGILLVTIKPHTHPGYQGRSKSSIGKSWKSQLRSLETTQDQQNPSCQNKNDAFFCYPSSFKWMEMVKVTYLNLINHDVVRHPSEKVTERKISKKTWKRVPFLPYSNHGLVEKNPKWNEISTLQGPIFHWTKWSWEQKVDNENCPRIRSWQEIKKKVRLKKKQTGRIPILVIQAVTFSSPSWRSLNPLKGSRFHHPKKVTLNHLHIRILHIPGIFFIILVRCEFFVIFRGFYPFLGSPDLPLHLVKLFRMGVFPNEWRWKNGDVESHCYCW